MDSQDAQPLPLQDVNFSGQLVGADHADFNIVSIDDDDLKRGSEAVATQLCLASASSWMLEGCGDSSSAPCTRDSLALLPHATSTPLDSALVGLCLRTQGFKKKKAS